MFYGNQNDGLEHCWFLVHVQSMIGNISFFVWFSVIKPYNDSQLLMNFICLVLTNSNNMSLCFVFLAYLEGTHKVTPISLCFPNSFSDIDIISFR